MPEFPLSDPADVRAAMDRILATPAFRRHEAAGSLLKYAVEEALAGRPAKLKPAPSAKLRALLSEYYAAEGCADPVRIALPRKAKSLVFSTSVPPAARPARRRWIWAPIALAAAMVLVWTGSWWRAYAASGQVRSLAILPFADSSPESGGLTQGVIDSLARIPGLHIAARTSAIESHERAHDIAAIGRELGVAAVLQGTVSHSGDRWRVAVQMDRVSDGYRLWNATLDEPTNDLFAVPQTVAAAIAKRIQIPSAPPAPPSHHPPPKAYATYLQGRDLFSPDHPQDFDKAAGFLEEATRQDPEFAQAWAWLSIVREYRVAADMERPNRAMPASRDAAERAVALDPVCGDSHLALGIVKLQYDWDWAAAKEELDRAIQASPESAIALEWHAHWYETQGRLEEALAEMQRALSLDPLSSVLSGEVAAEYLAANQPDRALPFAQKALELAPDDGGPKAVLADVLLRAGQSEQAQRIVEDLRNSPAGSKLPPYILPSLSAQLGDPESARQLLDEAEDLPDEQLMPFIAYVRLAAAIEDWERCFAWLSEAVNERDVQLPYFRLDVSLPKSDPRLADSLERMNLPATPSK